MSEFVVEIKEVYIVKYKCVGESKEEITRDYKEQLSFGIAHKLEPLHDPMEYYCDADEDAPHRVLTLKEYNDENEASDKAASETEEKLFSPNQLHGEVDDTYDPFEIAKEILDSDEEDEFVIEE